MSDSASSQGRFIRAALIIFPAGTIVLGIASFGIWWANKVKKEQRSYAYATALRRPIAQPAIERYTGILNEVLKQPDAERLPAVAGFLDSSMGAENMGYAVRRDRFFHGQIEASVVDVELTGKQRPREVVLILVPYGDAQRPQAEAQALAAMMVVAHAVTGERRAKTLRFVAAPLGVQDADGRSGLERVAATLRSREERLTQVFVLGGVAEPVLAQIREAFRVAQSGAIVQPLPATLEPPATLAAAEALQAAAMAALQ